MTCASTTSTRTVTRNNGSVVPADCATQVWATKDARRRAGKRSAKLLIATFKIRTELCASPELRVALPPRLCQLVHTASPAPDFLRRRHVPEGPPQQKIVEDLERSAEEERRGKRDPLHEDSRQRR